MIVYYIVILWVVMISGLAEKLDYKPSSSVSEASLPIQRIKISHSVNATYIFILASLVLVLVAGLRYCVGNDYGAYYHSSNKYTDGLWKSIISLDEPGYRLIVAFFRLIGINDGAYPVFVASAITIVIALFVVYRNSSHLWLSSILFVLLYWSSGFNAVRQCLAATFVFCGYSALRDKKIFRYGICVGIAFLFHRSAICMLFPYFFIHNKISITNMLMLILGCVVFLHSYDYAFDFTGAILDKEFNLEEIGGYNLNKVNRLRILYNCFPAAIFFIQTIKQKNKISYLHTFWVNILMFNAAISLSAMNSPYLSRMGIYFSPFLILAYCGLIHDMYKKQQKVFSWGICVYCGIFFLYESYKSSSLNHFQFIWQR